MCLDPSIEEINTTLLGNHDLEAWEKVPLGERKEEEVIYAIEGSFRQVEFAAPERA